MQSGITAITNSGQYMLHIALLYGERGSHSYCPQSKETKEAYELGIAKWLEKMSIKDVKPSELASSSALMQGFTCKLIAEGCGSFPAHEDWKIDQKDVFKKEIEKIRRQYEWIIRIDSDSIKDRELFEQGVQLASDYILGNTLYYFVTSSASLYDLDVKDLPEDRVKELFQIHRDI